jgi:hypothetical protein
MGSGGAGFTEAGGVVGGALAVAGWAATALVAGLLAAPGAGFGELELDDATEFAGAAELFATVGAGFEGLAADASAAADASDLGSDFLSDSFFFEPADITIDTTWSFCTSAKP